MKSLQVFLSALVVIALSACTQEANETGEQSGSQVQASGLENTKWQLVSFGQQAGEIAVADSIQIKLQFNPDNRVGGSGGCNSFGGGYEVQGASLVFDHIISTKMACADGNLMQLESQYFAALENAATFALNGDRLNIKDDSGQSVLQFRKTE